MVSVGGEGFTRDYAGICDLVDASQRCTSWPFTVLQNSDNVAREYDDYTRQVMLLVRRRGNISSIEIDSGQGNVVTKSQAQKMSTPKVIVNDVWDAGDTLFRLPFSMNPLSPEEPLNGRPVESVYLDGTVTLVLCGEACIKVNICVFPELFWDGSSAFTRRSRFDLRHEALSGCVGFSFRIPLSSRRHYFLLMSRKIKILTTRINHQGLLFHNQHGFQLIEFSLSSRKGLSSLLSSLLAVPPLVIYSLLVWPFWWFFPFFYKFRAWWRLFLVAGIVATTVSITTLILNDDTRQNKGTYGVLMAFIDGVLGLLLFLSLYPRIKLMLENI
ncbi:hypothetical protein CKM354_000658900 [Cercospora kikuchii]|nr:uncharacterized protein CKM354_000658900 [Cercospora kikuchii]GIZ43359.1 hypothetical protein CKM354_000658900 [Cercospora kikuchii]